MSRDSREICFSIKPYPPFRLDLTAWAIRRKPGNAIDRFDGTTYERVLSIRRSPVLVSVVQVGSPESPRLDVTLRAEDPISRWIRAETTQTLDKLLGVGVSLDEFYSLATHDLRLKPLVERFRGLKPPRFPSVFEALVNGICCQQLSLHVGVLLLNRLSAAYGFPITIRENPVANLHAFPDPEDLAQAKPNELCALGFSGKKADYLLEASRAASRREFDFKALETSSNEAAVQRLSTLHGVGRWTAEYVLLRGLGRLDSFPADDVGGQNKLTRFLHLRKPLDYERVHQVLKPWARYAGLIYFHLLLLNLEEEKRLTGVSSGENKVHDART